jgi:HEAT repeat protein
MLVVMISLASKVIADKDRSVRIAAAEALSRIKDARTLDPLIKALSGPD